MSQAPSNHSWMKRYGLLIVLLVALFARLGVLTVFADFENPDTFEYGVIARNLNGGLGYSFNVHDYYIGEHHKRLTAGSPEYAAALEGAGLPLRPTAFMLPGYTLLLAGLLSVFGGAAFTVAYALNLLAGLAAVWLVYLIGRDIFGERAAFLGGLLAALSPTVIAPTAYLQPTCLEAALGLLVVYLTVRLYQGDGRRGLLLLLGGVLGVAALVRQVILAYLAVILIVLLLAERAGDRAWWRRWLRAGGRWLIVLGACLLVLSPWMIFNAGRFDDFTPLSTKTGFNLLKGYGDAAGLTYLGTIHPALPPSADMALLNQPEPAMDADLHALSRRLIAERPWRALGLTAGRFGVGLVLDPAFGGFERGLGNLGAWAMYVFSIALFALALYGVIVERKRWRELLPILGFIAVNAAALSVTFIAGRFRVPIELCYAVLAGAGLSHLGGRIEERRRRRRKGSG